MDILVVGKVGINITVEHNGYKFLGYQALYTARQKIYEINWFQKQISGIIILCYLLDVKIFLIIWATLCTSPCSGYIPMYYNTFIRNQQCLSAER